MRGRAPNCACCSSAREALRPPECAVRTRERVVGSTQAREREPGALELGHRVSVLPVRAAIRPSPIEPPVPPVALGRAPRSRADSSRDRPHSAAPLQPHSRRQIIGGRPGPLQACHRLVVAREPLQDDGIEIWPLEGFRCELPQPCCMPGARSPTAPRRGARSQRADSFWISRAPQRLLVRLRHRRPSLKRETNLSGRVEAASPWPAASVDPNAEAARTAASRVADSGIRTQDTETAGARPKKQGPGGNPHRVQRRVHEQFPCCSCNPSV